MRKNSSHDSDGQRWGLRRSCTSTSTSRPLALRPRRCHRPMVCLVFEWIWPTFGYKQGQVHGSFCAQNCHVQNLYGVEVQVLCWCSLAPGGLVERTGVWSPDSGGGRWWPVEKSDDLVHHDLSWDGLYNQSQRNSNQVLTTQVCSFNGSFLCSNARFLLFFYANRFCSISVQAGLNVTLVGLANCHVQP